MLNTTILFALRHRLLVVVSTLLLLVIGTKTIFNMPIDVFPDLNRPTVTIMTEVEGYAPEEVEVFVTRPIEMAMNGLTGVSRVRSVSGIGLSIVYVEFGWKTELLKSRQIVFENLASLKSALPANVTPVIGPMTSIMGEIMLVGLTSDDISPMDLRTIADWTIKPRIQAVSGVSQVIAIGGGVKQFQIEANPLKLREHDLSFNDLKEAASQIGRNTTGGYIEDSYQEYLIRNIGRITSLEDIINSPVTSKNGVSIPFSQVATVREGIQTKRGDASINGKPGVILSIQKQPGSNTVTLTKQIEQALKDVTGSLPKSVQTFEIFKQSNFIEAAIKNVELALRDGAIMVALVLFLFLLNFRTTVITLTAIPISLVVTAIVLQSFGISINTMTLGGIAVAIGELVDDAIVDVENVFRRLRENRQSTNPLSPLKVIYQASSEVRHPIVMATLIVILVFIPLFFMQGIEGKLFAPLGIAYVVSILASLVVSLTLTPVLCSYILVKFKAHDDHKESGLVRFLKRQDLKLLEYSLDHPKLMMGISAVLVMISLGSIGFMGREFLPPFNEGTVTISLLSKPGTSLSESNKLGMIAEQQILSVAEVISVGRRTGRAEQDEHAEGVHSSELDVDLKISERSRGEILQELRQKLAEIPGVFVSIGQPISHRLDHLLSGVRAQIALKVFGPDLSTLRSTAQSIQESLKLIPGVVDLHTEKIVLIPQIQITPHQRKTEQFALPKGALNEWLENAFHGLHVARAFEGDQSFDVRLRMDESYRTTPQTMGELLVDTPSGVKVPLRELAQIQMAMGPNQINRENSQRRIVVSANTQDRDLGSVVADIRKVLANQIKLPEGYYIELGGQFESQVSATRTIGVLSLISLLGIFFVLYVHFGSAMIALQILINIPLALIGSVVAVYLSSGTLSVASLVGFVTLCGIASRNGIMMISHYIHLMAYEGEVFDRKMIIRGSLERLVPVLMTALTAALALLPIVFSPGEPGKEILHPVAVVILGGLISSTVLDMAVTPAVFFAFGKNAAAHAVARLTLQEKKEFKYVASMDKQD